MRSRFIVPLVFALFGCGAQEAPAPQKRLHTTDLRLAVDSLAAAGCLSEGDRDELLDALGTGPAGDVDAFDSRLRSEDDVCEAGRTLLRAILDTGAQPLLEKGRIVFDASGDGCPDTILDSATLALEDVDANDDGCVDLIWDLRSLSAYQALEPGAKASADEQLDLILDALIHPSFVADAPSETTDAWRERRQMATASFEQLRAVVGEGVGPLSQNEREVLSAFLDHIEPFLAEFSGCLMGSSESTQSPVPEGCDGDAACEPKTPRFYVFTDGEHAWKGLTGVDTTGKAVDHRRGFYPAGSIDPRIPVPQAGRVLNEEGRPWTHRICYDVTPDEWHRIRDSINSDLKDPPKYEVVDRAFVSSTRNCMGWAADNAAKIGRRLPEYTWMGVPDPEKLQESLQRLIEAGESGPGDEVQVNRN